MDRRSLCPLGKRLCTLQCTAPLGEISGYMKPWLRSCTPLMSAIELLRLVGGRSIPGNQCKLPGNLRLHPTRAPHRCEAFVVMSNVRLGPQSGEHTHTVNFLTIQDMVNPSTCNLLWLYSHGGIAHLTAGHRQCSSILQCYMDVPTLVPNNTIKLANC